MDFTQLDRLAPMYADKIAYAVFSRLCRDAGLSFLPVTTVKQELYRLLLTHYTIQYFAKDDYVEQIVISTSDPIRLRILFHQAPYGFSVCNCPNGRCFCTIPEDGVGSIMERLPYAFYAALLQMGGDVL